MQRICVYCGSSPGKRPEYLEATRALAREMASRNIGLVYGGASVGMMGALADEMLKQGGEAIGVIPQALIDREISHRGLTELKVVGSMHERKAAMADVADGFIALPGGLGTLEELFEIMTWAQLGFHRKPCGLLNTEGYYDHLSLFLQRAVDDEFIKPVHRDMLLVESQPETLLDAMATYKPPLVDKWIGRQDT